jgi:hypothetical protein
MKKTKYSKNERAKSLVGLRAVGGNPIDFPCELGYHCPVCEYELLQDGNYDERLMWSEYNGFLWCSVCNKDYPTVLCTSDIDKAIEIYLDCVEDVIKNHER